MPGPRQTLTHLERDGAHGAVALDGLKSDVADLDETFRGLYVGASGDVKLTMPDDTEVTFVGLAAGVCHPLWFYKLWDTGTTATGILGLR